MSDIRIRVLLFASLAEQAGARELDLTLPEGASAGEALEALCEAIESVARARASLAVAVNERYALASQALRDGDVLALIPPVSGG